MARAAGERVARYLRALQTFFLGCLGDVRQALAAPRPPGKEGPGLPDLLATLSSSVLGQLKAVLAYVQLFTTKDVAFASLPYFKVGWGQWGELWGEYGGRWGGWGLCRAGWRLHRLKISMGLLRRSHGADWWSLGASLE